MWTSDLSAFLRRIVHSLYQVWTVDGGEVIIGGSSLLCPPLGIRINLLTEQRLLNCLYTIRVLIKRYSERFHQEGLARTDKSDYVVAGIENPMDHYMSS